MSATGEVTFGIRAINPNASSDVIPVCVSVPVIAGRKRYDQGKQMAVFFSQGIRSNALAVVRQSQIVESSGGSCEMLRACDKLFPTTLTVAFSGGVDVGGQGGTGGGGSSGGGPVDAGITAATQDVNVSVSLQPVGDTGASATAPSLATSLDCSELVGANLTVRIPAGRTSSDRFALCTDGSGGTFRVSAVVANQIAVSGQNDVNVPPAIKRAYAGTPNAGLAPLFVEHCGDTSRRATIEDIATSAAVRVDEEEKLVIDVRQQGPSGGVDGGVVDAAGADSDATPATAASSIAITLAHGRGNCQLSYSEQ